MKQLLLICAVVALVGCSPTVKIADPIIEKEIRRQISKYTGELTKADLKKVTHLYLENNKLTDVKGLENLTQLKELELRYSRGLTKVQIAELKKALPKCKIFSDFE